MNPKTLLTYEEIDSFCSTMLDEDDPFLHLQCLLQFLIVCEEEELYEYCDIIILHIHQFMY